jgi:hypothetical protein
MKDTRSLDERLRYGARLVLSRDPTEGELATLRKLYQQTLHSPGPPRIVKISSHAPGESAKQLAALTTVASVLFNLDAALTR